MTIKNLLSIALVALAMSVFPQQGFTGENETPDKSAQTTEAAPDSATEVVESGTEAVESTAEMAEPATAETAGSDPVEAEKVSIMDIPLDGSSVKAFKASMAAVENDASLGDYNHLKSAVEYLLVFDLSANRDQEKLYANLDGKTPTEVIAMTADGKR